MDPTAVTLVIKDQGPGFNPGDVPHAASEEAPIAHLDVRNELGFVKEGSGSCWPRGWWTSSGTTRRGTRSRW